MCTNESPFFLTPGSIQYKCWLKKPPMGINKLYVDMKEPMRDWDTKPLNNTIVNTHVCVYKTVNGL